MKVSQNIFCNIVIRYVTMLNESVALLTPASISSYLIAKGNIIFVAFELAAAVVTAMAQFFGEAMGEAIGNDIFILIISLDGW